MRKGFSFLAGLLAGAVVGVAAAMLLAPYSGTELQERMRTRAQGLIEEGKRAAAARRAELEAQLEAFKRGNAVTIETTPEQPNTRAAPGIDLITKEKPGSFRKTWLLTAFRVLKSSSRTTPGEW